MHGFPVGWDLISLHNHMGWTDKLFTLYLALVVGFSLFRSLRLARSLWSYFPPRRIGSHDKRTEVSEMLATTALTNRVSLTNGLLDKSDIFPAKSEGPEKCLQIVEAAAPRFQYLWAKANAKVVVMKNLAVLTVILCVLALSYDLMKLIGIWPIPRCGDCSGGPAELLVPVVLGLAVSAVLFALSTFFASVLARRQAEWNLFVANVNIQHKTE